MWQWNRYRWYSRSALRLQNCPTARHLWPQLSAACVYRELQVFDAADGATDTADSADARPIPSAATAAASARRTFMSLPLGEGPERNRNRPARTWAVQPISPSASPTSPSVEHDVRDMRRAVVEPDDELAAAPRPGRVRRDSVVVPVS